MDEYSCLNYCIFTKLSQIVCLINVLILVCQPMSTYQNEPGSLIQLNFLGNFYILQNVMALSDFYKLCVKEEVYRDEKETYVMFTPL